MTKRGPTAAAGRYTPHRRTALVLSGTGTAGAYHAGVLRALHEAGTKIDVVAGRGIGVIGALFAAVDGGQRLWDDKGLWRSRRVAALYGWRPAMRAIVGALVFAAALVLVPVLAVAAGLVVFPIDFLLKLVGVPAGSGLVDVYVTFAARAFAPDMLPTWLPRLVLLTLGAAGAAGALTAWLSASSRRKRGAPWWRLALAPLDRSAAVRLCWSGLWDLLRGAAPLGEPEPVELARRYGELLADNLGQPGFRELVLTAHDLDARRDLVFALVTESRRRDLVRRPTLEEAEGRRAEVLDLSGVARDHLVDAVSGALALPLVTEPHLITFAPDAFWCGETHRLCDRPGSLLRLIDELAGLGVEQILLVSAAPQAPGPHALAPSRLEMRGRLGEYIQSSEGAVVRDAGQLGTREVPYLFTIQPAHNPVGPFDVGGGFDDRSDRAQPLAELVSRGYHDAYHQFIEPIVGAGGVESEELGMKT